MVSLIRKELERENVVAVVFVIVVVLLYFLVLEDLKYKHIQHMKWKRIHYYLRDVSYGKVIRISPEDRKRINALFTGYRRFLVMDLRALPTIEPQNGGETAPLKLQYVPH